jgi:flagellar hook-associated protein 1
MRMSTPVSDELSRYLNLSSQQLGLTARNVANANTPGYTREAANWQENTPVVLNGQGYGMGATMTGFSSKRDRVLEQTLQQQTQQQQATNTRLSALQNIESIFNTAATNSAATTNASGIDAAMTQFFDSLSQLESNPADNTLRQVVLSAAGQMSNSFQGAIASLSQQQQSLDEQSITVISQVNALARSIAALNGQIETNSPNSDAGALEDQRQLDLTQLSQLIGVHLVTADNNGLTVTTANGATLVAGNESFALTAAPAGGVSHLYDSSGKDLTAELAGGGGQLGGLLTARDQDIPQVESALDALARGLASTINTIHHQGADANGNPGSDFFSITTPAASPTPGSVAASLAVAIQDPAEIAAAGYSTTPSAAPPPAFLPLGSSDGSNLLLMADAQNQACISLATAGFLTVSTATSPTSFYSDFTTALGALVAQTSTLNTAQQASLTQLQNQRNALSTVDLNEEAAAMSSLERSYQAASKVFSILDSIISSALNLGMQSTVS